MNNETIKQHWGNHNALDAAVMQAAGLEPSLANAMASCSVLACAADNSTATSFSTVSAPCQRFLTPQ